MLMRLLKWLRGVLIIQISGTAPERFINLCCNRKINIWNVKKAENSYQFTMYVSGFRGLKPIARKTHIVPRIVKKTGLPFFLHKYKKRKIFFGGTILCLLLIYIMSLYIWDISIQGGSKYTPEAMMKFLNQNSIHTGIKKEKVNCQEIEEKIRLTYKDIGWVSAEIKGTRLILKLKETNMPKPADQEMEPSHIIATKDAIVKSIITRSGTPLVREGDVVKKGDILVSGIVTVMGDFEEILSKEPVVADADIKCKSFYNYKDIFSMDYTIKKYTGRDKNGLYVSILRKKLFLYNPRYSYLMYDIIVNEKKVHITKSFYLPLSYGTMTTREYLEEKKKYTKEEAIALSKARMDRYLDSLIQKDVLITANNVTITIKDNRCIAKGRILVEEPAWEYKTIQENEWRIEPTDEHNGDNH